MPFPTPFPGLVLHYSYLWREQYQQGKEEGTKNRPCVVVLAVAADGGETVVTVVPVTHSPPENPKDAVEIPTLTKRRLGLDDARSWIVIKEANRFLWPGFDLRQVPGKSEGSFDYGVLPPGLFRKVKESFLINIQFRKLKVTSRDN